MPNLSYIYSPETETFTFVVNGKVFNVAKDSHRNFDKIKEALKNRELDKIESLLDLSYSLVSYSKGNVEVKNGNVYYKGDLVHNTICDRIFSLMDEGLPFEPMVNFLENLMLNPSRNSVQQLYKFLEHRSLPITEDGCFLGYKGVRRDFYDKYSGTFLNAVGTTVSVPRNYVDDNMSNECSFGLHVGSLDYAKNYIGGDGVLVVVKVNPADCVAVPADHNFQKLRVCKYDVVSVLENELSESPLYGSDAKPKTRDDFAMEDDLHIDVEWGDNNEEDLCGDSACDECYGYYNKRDANGRFTK